MPPEMMPGTPPPGPDGPASPSPIGGPEAQPLQPPPPGPTAPATVAPPDAGLALQGRIEVSIALKMLTKALSKVGATTPDGVKLAKQIYDLGKVFGEAQPDIEQQELKLMASSLAPVSAPMGGGSPGGNPLEQAQQGAADKLGALGLTGGGGAPPGPPPMPGAGG